MVFAKELKKNLMVVPSSGYHFPLPAPDRIESLLDKDSFQEFDKDLRSSDPLEFKGVSSYKEKLEQNREKTQLEDAVITGVGKMGGYEVSLAVMDFRFLGGSMGSVVGEKITQLLERAPEENTSHHCFCIGGARMYEWNPEFDADAKTSLALAQLAAKGIPYFSVLTNPTMAGVMASYASLGDVILAEPKALIGFFAGRRVIKETTRADLPEGFQTSEFLLEHGLIDQIVDRAFIEESTHHPNQSSWPCINSESKKASCYQEKTVTKTSTVTRRRAPTKKKN